VDYFKFIAFPIEFSVILGNHVGIGIKTQVVITKHPIANIMLIFPLGKIK
jgi:hypothetical protein